MFSCMLRKPHENLIKIVRVFYINIFAICKHVNFRHIRFAEICKLSIKADNNFFSRDVLFKL